MQMGDSKSYRAFRFFGAPFRYRVEGLDNVRGPGPALFVGNHLGALGPVQSILSVPLRFYPWAIGEMLDPARAPAYLHQDFVGPGLHLDGRLGSAFSWLLSRITVRLLTNIGSIPVESASGWTAGAFRRSLALLAEGKNVLVFPENPKGEVDPETGMRAFNCGFSGLARMALHRGDGPLPVYPLAVHAGRKTVRIEPPLFYEDRGAWRADTLRFCGLLQERVRSIYRDLDDSVRP
jgi:hypothetical protein